MAIPHNSKCRYGERGAADAKPKAQIILDAAKVSAASGGNSEPKHDAGTATRHYRAFWQRRCRAAAAGAVLKPQGGNCAVLLKALFLWIRQKPAGRCTAMPNREGGYGGYQSSQPQQNLSLIHISLDQAPGLTPERVGSMNDKIKEMCKERGF